MNIFRGDAEEFIFSESGMGFGYDAEIEKQEKETGVIECVDDPDVACYRIALENEQNFNAILCAITEAEVGGYVTEGVMETARNILDKVKEAIQKFWAKVKGVFKKVMDMVGSFVLTNKKFVKVYRAKADNYSTPNKKFTGYKFDGLEKGINYADAADKVKGIIKGTATGPVDLITSDKFDAHMNVIRGVLLNGGPIKRTDFNKELKSYLYGNNGNSTTMNALPFNTLLDELENAKEVKAWLKDSYKSQQDAVKELLDDVKDLRSKSGNDENHLKICKGLSKVINGTLSMMSMAHSAEIKAFSTYMRQCRAMANAYIRGNKVSDYVESFDITSSTSDSSLNIELV